MIKNAIVSVFDKQGLVEFGEFLVNRGVTIYSTGGTYKRLVSAIGSDRIREVSSVTEFPEMLDGRVKTLHPKIHGGLLARRDKPQHMAELAKHGIPAIDLVVANLYPFEQVVKQAGVDEDTVLENIDIGGHTLIRASAKNYRDVLTVVDPRDYTSIMKSWDTIGDLRKRLASKAWNHITKYDQAITRYFDDGSHIFRTYEQTAPLKYGTNPQQGFAGVYRNEDNKSPFTVVQGNPGYINMLDAVYSWNLVCELSKNLGLPATASFKHTSPAGVGLAIPLTHDQIRAYMVEGKELTPVATSFVRARNVDPMSSFGDFLAISDVVDECTARLIACEVSDGIVAPGYTPEALDVLKAKRKGGYLILQGDPNARSSPVEIREMHGLTLVQEENQMQTTRESLENVPTKNNDLNNFASRDLILANTTLKYTQSNSVCSAMDGQTLGVGAGQQSRIDCVKLVKRKTHTWYLRQHPKCLRLLDLFKPGTKRVEKINAIIRYIEDDFTPQEYGAWINLFVEEPEKLTSEERTSWLSSLRDVSLASDAFFPFRDNIDVASQFGTKYLVQPGGSIADDVVIEACNSYDMVMAMTGKDMRMFLH